MIQNRKSEYQVRKIVQGQRNPTGETFQVKSYYPACFSLPLTGERWEGGGGVAMAAAEGAVAALEINEALE